MFTSDMILHIEKLNKKVAKILKILQSSIPKKQTTKGISFLSMWFWFHIFVTLILPIPLAQVDFFAMFYFPTVMHDMSSWAGGGMIGHIF